MSYQKKIVSLFSGTILSLAFTTQLALAGMTISGTRIIFPAAEREQTVRTTNKGHSPLLVQVWVDDGSKNDDINSIKVPFTVTPPVYRVEPGRGQSIRLIYNGMVLPQDRESVFYFNLLEIPPVDEKVKNTDRLELAFRTRIKIFYRPTVLTGSSYKDINKVRWEVISPTKGIKVTNPTPYYFSFDSAFITSGGVNYPLSVDMVAPFSSRDFPVQLKGHAPPVTVNGAGVSLISDYGSVIKYNLIPGLGKVLTIKE